MEIIYNGDDGEFYDKKGKKLHWCSIENELITEDGEYGKG